MDCGGNYVVSRSNSLKCIEKLYDLCSAGYLRCTVKALWNA